MKEQRSKILGLCMLERSEKKEVRFYPFWHPKKQKNGLKIEKNGLKMKNYSVEY